MGQNVSFHLISSAFTEKDFIGEQILNSTELTEDSELITDTEGKIHELQERIGE